MVDKRVVSIKKNLKEYWNFVKQYKLKLASVIFIILIIESLMLVEKLLYKKLIDDSTDFVGGIIPQSTFIAALWLILIIFSSASLGRHMLSVFHMRLKQYLEADLVKDIKNKYFSHIIRLSHSFHLTHKSGSLIARLGRGQGAIEDVNSFFIDSLFPFVVRLIVVGISLYYFDKMSLVITVSTMILFIAFSTYIQGKQNIARKYNNEAEDIEKGYTADTLANVDSVKYFGKENIIINRFLRFVTQSRNTFLNYVKYQNITRFVQGMILSVGTICVVYFSVRQMIAGNLTVGTLAFIYATYISLQTEAATFARQLRMLSRAMIDFNSLTQYGEIKNEIIDYSNSKYFNIKKGNIKFDNVYFSYQSNKIFNSFNLNINPGEKVAFVGSSGSGKSTLIKLLYRLYDVDKGKILIDGLDIQKIDQESLRSELSIVPQEAVLFDDTIYNNILFSNPNASRKEVLRAIKFAQLDKLIARLPKKENTLVGQRGLKLSGGEKQRVSIARALLANKKILILDEATSSLDSETESDIQKDLELLLRDKTALIIAHRLSTVMRADRIIVLDKGKIVQMGKHNELISQKGRYRELWNLQKGGYLLD